MSCFDEATACALVADRVPVAERDALESHLETCDSCMALLMSVESTGDVDAEPDPTLLEAGAAASTIPRALSEGDLVDHFRVEKMVGRGGMGEVYLAEDTELGRRVALKLIAPKWWARRRRWICSEPKRVPPQSSTTPTS